MRPVVLLLFVVACSGSSAPAPTAASGPPAPMTATAASSDDVVVARVNDKPIYGSCVAAQAARGATRQAALEECIGFELLAQHAQGFATDPEVILATRTALVSQFIAREYEDKFNRPSDFGAFWDKALQRNKKLVEHGEARASAYLRIPLGKNATDAEDKAARVLAEELASALANERGLTPAHLKELGDRIMAGRGALQFDVVGAYLNERGGLHAAYAERLFALPEVGRTAPAVRTSWGWDIVLCTEIFPAEKLTPDEVATKLLPEVKRSYFATWARQAAPAVSVKLFEQNVPLLEEL